MKLKLEITINNDKYDDLCYEAIASLLNDGKLISKEKIKDYVKKCLVNRLNENVDSIELFNGYNFVNENREKIDKLYIQYINENFDREEYNKNYGKINN